MSWTKAAARSDEGPVVTVQDRMRRSAAEVAADRRAPAPAGPERRAAEPTEGRWESRPWTARLVRLVAIAIPLLASIATSWVLSRIIHRPDGAATIVWWVGIALASTLVLIAVDRVARRLVPLAVLLRLSMAFPDQAPSRFKVAARAGTTRKLQEQLHQAETAVDDEQPMHAAQRILSLVAALGAHDRRTRGHSERVRAFNDLIAAEMRLPQADRDRLRWAALLHDIGKLHIPHRILNKPSKPTEKEWQILRSHPTRGARITAPLAEWLGPWASTIEQHHERWDGRGYPNGFAGDQISLGGRIVAVADAYEVMTAPRPYSRPVSAEAARRELARCAGGQFDPEVVRAFLNVSLGSLRRVIGPISWLAQLPVLGAAPRLESAVGAAGRQFVTAAATATGGGVLAVGALAPSTSPHHHIAVHAHETAAQLHQEGAPAPAPLAGQPPAPAPEVQPSVEPSTAPAAPATAPAGATPTESSRPTPAATPVVSPSVTPSATPTVTVTPLPTVDPTPTPTPTPTETPTPTPTETPTPTPTETPTPTPTETPTPTPTETPTPTPTASATATPSPTTTSGDQTLTGVVAGPLVVQDGQTIVLQDATVTGDVTVNEGGGLLVSNSTIQGSLDARRATALDICGSEIDGDLTVDEASDAIRIGDAPSSGCGGNVINGSVALTHNRFGVRLYSNLIAGSAHLTENRGGNGVIVAANIISGSLEGTGNQDVSNDGMPNTYSSSSGDMSGL